MPRGYLTRGCLPRSVLRMGVSACGGVSENITFVQLLLRTIKTIAMKKSNSDVLFDDILGASLHKTSGCAIAPLGI